MDGWMEYTLDVCTLDLVCLSEHLGGLILKEEQKIVITALMVVSCFTDRLWKIFHFSKALIVKDLP